MKFWDVIKEVSAQPVRKEAGRLFVLSVAGEREAVAAARAEALRGAGELELAAAEPFFFSASPPYSEEDERRLRYSDLLVSLPGGPAITEFRPADTLLLERPETLVPAVLAYRPELRVSLARRLPGFRAAAADVVVREVSRVNAECAVLSGLSRGIPWLLPLFPAVAGADIFLLTKNQVLMLFRLAAIYGEDLDLKSRARDVAAVIAGALGWRQLARVALGGLPFGIGLPARAGMAYAATYAIGRSAQMVFDSGRRPSRADMLRIYDDARRLGREAAGRLRPGSRRALPPPDPAGEEEASGAEARTEGDADEGR